VDSVDPDPDSQHCSKHTCLNLACFKNFSIGKPLPFEPLISGILGRDVSDVFIFILDLLVLEW